MEIKLEPCPFCGGPAGFEEITPSKYPHTNWSVGCTNTNEDCIGFQMLASFSRKCEAAEAWNKRDPNFIMIQKGPPDRVDEIMKPYLGMINSTPALQSLLYDIDMLPEQTLTIIGAIRLAGLCEVWKRMAAAESLAAAHIKLSADTVPDIVINEAAHGF